MVTSTRFGRKLKVPSTVELKHQFLLWWLASQQKKEAAELSENKADTNASSPVRSF